MAAKPISPAVQQSTDLHDPLVDEVSVSQPGPFYGGPFQKADFSHWAKMLVWNWFEIGCLTCGYEPSLLSDLEVEEAKSASPLAYEEVPKRWTLVQREQFAESGTRPMAPLDVLNWLDSIEVDYPSELRDVATRIAKKRLSPVMSAPLGLPNSYQRAIAKTAWRPLTAKTRPARHSLESIALCKRPHWRWQCIATDLIRPHRATQPLAKL